MVLLKILKTMCHGELAGSEERPFVGVCLEKAVDGGILVEKEHKGILEMMSY